LRCRATGGHWRPLAILPHPVPGCRQSCRQSPGHKNAHIQRHIYRPRRVGARADHRQRYPTERAITAGGRDTATPTTPPGICGAVSIHAAGRASLTPAVCKTREGDKETGPTPPKGTQKHPNWPPACIYIKPNVYGLSRVPGVGNVQVSRRVCGWCLNPPKQVPIIGCYGW